MKLHRTKMKQLKLFCPLLIAAICCSMTDARTATETRKRENRKRAGMDVCVKTPYQKIFDGKHVVSAVSDFLIVHKVEGKIYFEMPLEVMGMEMFITATPATTQYVRGCVVGLRQRDPLHVMFRMEDSTVLMMQMNDRFMRSMDERVRRVLQLGASNTVHSAWPVKAYSPDSLAVVFDATDLFTTDVPELSPVGEGYEPFDVTYKMKPNLSRIREVGANSHSVTIRTSTQYTMSEWRFLFPLAVNVPNDVDVVYNVMLLPESRMRPRLANDRIGTFEVEKRVFDENGGPIERVRYAARWNLVPSNMEAYLRGEMVEPEKPITMYVDPHFPDLWKSAVKTGILRWNAAFEKIGFKNAIRAVDFPANDPDFDPFNFACSCVWYVPSNVENAEGHVWMDPRSGEILSATIAIHQQVAQKLNYWRFVQTAQIDPRVRNVRMPEDVMFESIAYLASHEMGHALGLTHNMAASAAFPVDSLRSATFTARYGTTASVMDYARFNYVAQPEDTGVKLTPPDLGVYDEYAIRWLYLPFPESVTPEEEYAVLEEWIALHDGNPFYRYAAQQERVYNRLDPTAAEEDLGNDAILAGEYGMRNLRYIMEHLPQWIGPHNDADGTYRKNIETQLLKQYQLYLERVWANVSGYYLYNEGENENGIRYLPVPRQVQKASVEWVLRQLRECEMLHNPQVYRKFVVNLPSPLKAANLISRNLGMVNYNVGYNASLSDDPYTLAELYDDFFLGIWKNSIENRKLTAADKLLQRNFIDGGELRLASIGGNRLLSSSSGPDGYWECDDPRIKDFGKGEDGIFANEFSSDASAVIPNEVLKLYDFSNVYSLHLMRRVRTLLEKRIVDAVCPDDRPFYRAQLLSVEKILKPKE